MATGFPRASGVDSCSPPPTAIRASGPTRIASTFGRDLRGHIGWGYGIHACVGRVLALLEADALLGALIRHIERFEPAGEPEPWMTTIGHGPSKLPMRIHAVAH